MNFEVLFTWMVAVGWGVGSVFGDDLSKCNLLYLGMDGPGYGGMGRMGGEFCIKWIMSSL